MFFNNFSLLRKYYPKRGNWVTLLDDSGFSWNDSRGKKYKTNFLKGYLLLHRKTWYEDKFNAVMCNPDIYSEYRKKADNNFFDPLHGLGGLDEIYFTLQFQVIQWTTLHW